MSTSPDGENRENEELGLVFWYVFLSLVDPKR
jgi:hypothetical protein